MIGGMIFLQESITLFMLIGAALVLTGISLTEGVFQRKKNKE
jgi:drug/metabolite transporter (DMT)-like permease